MRRISEQPKSSKQYLGISKKMKKIRMIMQEKMKMNVVKMRWPPITTVLVATPLLQVFI